MDDMEYRAWVVAETGATPRIERNAVRDPASDEICIAIRACGLNFADLLMIGGTYQETPPFPLTPGMEVSGVVSAVGADVIGFAEGDRVLAFSGHGGLAGVVNVNACRCLKIPKGMDFETAAGFQITYGTSHLALTRRAALRTGEQLVVLGAAGGVGLTAVEIGKALGAHVTAVARGQAKLSIARDAGADALVDSGSVGDLTSELRKQGGADVLYDAVGGNLGTAAHRALRPEGRHLLIGFASGDTPELRPNHILVKNTSVIGFNWGGYLKFAPEALHASLSELIAWHEAGRIRPKPSHILPFERALEGLDMLRERRAVGKIVVKGS